MTLYVATRSCRYDAIGIRQAREHGLDGDDGTKGNARQAGSGTGRRSNGGWQLASDERHKAAGEGTARRAPRKPAPAENGPVGDALRTVYEQTVRETIPPEMLDLLGKLD